MHELIEKAQRELRERGLDGWLLYDFRGSNRLALAFLQREGGMTTRRFYYWIPSHGEAIKIVHAIEPHALDQIPGQILTYDAWEKREAILKRLIHGKKIAMEISEEIPTLSLVDGGTIDRLRSLGGDIVSSAPFLTSFTSVMSERQKESFRLAGKELDQIVHLAFDLIGERIRKKEKITEWDVQQFIVAELEKRGMEANHPAICAVNAHTADPHYEPKKGFSLPITADDFVLIDLWGKKKGEKNIYADICRVAAMHPTEEQKRIFSIVREAQKKATRAAHLGALACSVDRIARDYIREHGYGEFFTHRTGHSIYTTPHADGPNIDDFETRDTRPLIKDIGCSIEPGIYLPGRFGIRLEYDLLIGDEVEIIGGIQDEIRAL